MVTRSGGNAAKQLKTVLEERSWLRILGPGLALAGVIVVLTMLLTGRIDLSRFSDWRGGDELAQEAAADTPVKPVSLAALGEKSSDTIRIATFNVHGFRKEKASDPTVMPVIVKILSQFDVIALQEVNGGDHESVQAVLSLLRASGGSYSATISEPIGPAEYAESYAFVWDNSRIQLIEQSAYVVDDRSNRLHREPMVASFESRVGTEDGRRPFRFTLINVHAARNEVVDADAVANEMQVLDDVFIRVRQFEHDATGEEDFILLGTLYADTKGLLELGQLPNVVSIAGDVKTNTQRTESRDHLLLDRTMTREYTGRFGLVDFQADLGLEVEQALRISDHTPLWAEFSAYEMPRFQQFDAQSESTSVASEQAPPQVTEK